MILLEIEHGEEVHGKLSLVEISFDDFLMNEGKLSMEIAYEFDGTVTKDFMIQRNGKQYGVYFLCSMGTAGRKRFLRW